jgi:hypothetical protein
LDLNGSDGYAYSTILLFERNTIGGGLEPFHQAARITRSAVSYATLCGTRYPSRGNLSILVSFSHGKPRAVVLTGLPQVLLPLRRHSPHSSSTSRVGPVLLRRPRIPLPCWPRITSAFAANHLRPLPRFTTSHTRLPSPTEP